MTGIAARLRIEQAAKNLDLAAERLTWLLREHCPGPHSFGAYHDGYPPWCKTCGYRVDGRRVDSPDRAALR